MVLRKLWMDELGATLSLETVLVASIGVLGVTGGIASLAGAVTAELGDVAQVVRSINQSYAVNGFQLNGTISTGTPCKGAGTSTSFQASNAGSGFIQAQPNFVFQDFNRNVNLGQLDLTSEIAGQQAVQQQFATSQLAQPQFVQPQQLQSVPSPNSVNLLNDTRPQSARVQEFTDESVELLREVPLDETTARPSASRTSRFVPRSNRITTDDCKPTR